MKLEDSIIKVLHAEAKTCCIYMAYKLENEKSDIESEQRALDHRKELLPTYQLRLDAVNKVLKQHGLKQIIPGE